AMALSGALERLQEEAICSICLEYMTEPVSVDCGHNFCHGCITKHCQEKCLWNDAPFSCPQCRAPCRRSSLRPNRQLANIVESIRQLRLGGGVAPGTLLSMTSASSSSVRWMKRPSAWCAGSRESQHHRSHTVYPIEEAAQVYK
ncbi:Tripartite motif-containing protein 58, partial [Anas platyrhynchos]